MLDCWMVVGLMVDRCALALRGLVQDLVTHRLLDLALVRFVHQIADDLAVAVAVSLLSDDPARRHVAASAAGVLRFERLQHETGQGPCLSAWASGNVVSVPDLAGDDRFPMLAEAAVTTGSAALFCFPVRRGDRRAGTLTLYRRTPGPLEGSLGAAGRALADMLARVLELESSDEVDALSVRALEASEARYRTLVAHLPDTSVTVFDADLRVLMAAGPAVSTGTYATTIRPGQRLDDYLSPVALAFMEPRFQAALEGTAASFPYHSDVTGMDLHIEAVPMAAADGRVDQLLIVARDVGRQRADEEARRAAEERYRTAFDAAPVGMALTDLAGQALAVNDALCRLTGHTSDELCVDPLALGDPDGDHRAGDGVRVAVAASGPTNTAEARLVHADGHVVWVLRSTTVVHDAAGEPVHLLSHFLDITDRKRFDAQLQHLADHDPLTGLRNRRSFKVELDRQAASVARYGPVAALLVLDLDHFKQINDTLGHSTGDELIVSVAQLLRRRLRSTDVVARLGGDEFAVILPHATREEAELVARDLLETVRNEVIVLAGGPPRRITTCIGIAMFDEPGLTGEEVLIKADLSMYGAKEAGRDGYAMHPANGDEPPRTRSRLAWVDRIIHAFDHDRFTLFAQPILELSTSLVVRHELLLRMVGDAGEIIPPASFLGNAELLAFIERRLGECPSVDPSRLTFEVTETAAVANIGLAREFAQRLSTLGCSFALDDFGAGFGSFFYLKHLPFDDLKIDGEFVVNCLASPTDQLIIDALVRVARGLGKHTTAEFVGDEATLRFLAEHGVDFAQGFHVGHAVALGQVVAGATLATDEPRGSPWPSPADVALVGPTA